MSATLPEMRVGNSLRHEGLEVFPLFAAPSGRVEYDLSHEALERGTVTVDEVSEEGSVPDLSVENRGDLRVLFLEGEELVGAKQNRILNTSVLVAAHTKSRIPVSCVEAGRWRYRSSHFTSGGTHSPYQLRRVLKKSVAKSVRAHRGHRSHQGGVWDEIARKEKALGAVSGTHAMHDTFEAYQERLDAYQEKLNYVEGAVGVAVAVGGRVAALDLFDKPETCGRVWNRLLSGAILDALEVKEVEKRVEPADVERGLTDLGGVSWEPAEAVGEGEEYRAESSAGDLASTLVFDGTVVHGSVVCAR